ARCVGSVTSTSEVKPEIATAKHTAAKTAAKMTLIFAETFTACPHSEHQLRALDLFRLTAARTRVFNAVSSIFSPSWKSIARRVFPSRLELKRRAGSFRAAPLAKVIFTTLL